MFVKAPFNQQNHHAYQNRMNFNPAGVNLAPPPQSQHTSSQQQSNPQQTQQGQAQNRIQSQMPPTQSNQQAAQQQQTQQQPQTQNTQNYIQQHPSAGTIVVAQQGSYTYTPEQSQAYYMQQNAQRNNILTHQSQQPNTQHHVQHQQTFNPAQYQQYFIPQPQGYPIDPSQAAAFQQFNAYHPTQSTILYANPPQWNPQTRN